MAGAGMGRQRAYSLPEAMAVLLILGLLIKVSLPPLSAWLQQTVTASMQRQFFSALTLGREEAIMHNSMVSFCGSSSGSACDGKWSEGSILFIDHNANAVMEPDDRLLRHIQPDKSANPIYWRSFGNKRYLQLTPLGFTNNQSGNFTFCTSDSGSRGAQQIIVNRTGRFRLARDKDGDGLVEDASGSGVRCN